LEKASFQGPNMPTFSFLMCKAMSGLLWKKAYKGFANANDTK